ncbi:MAG: peptidase dimerization domain-containing protein, partial [Gemmatimonadota bacterium]
MEPREQRWLRSFERATGQPITVQPIPSVADLQASRAAATQAALRAVVVAGGLEPWRGIVDALAAEFDPRDIAAAAVRQAMGETGTAAEEEIPDARERHPAREREAVRKARREATTSETAGMSATRPTEARPARGPAVKTPRTTAKRKGAGPAGAMAKLYLGAGRKLKIRPGNLRGVRHLFTKEFPGQIQYFISVDGAGGGAITSRAVGSHRYTVSFEGPGGHSYGAFGMANPMHAMGRAIANIADLRVPTTPKVTYNVGIVRGGTSVNTITPLAQMEVDMRSESPEALATVDAQIRAAIEAGAAAERARWPNSRAGITVKFDTIGIRPTGAQSDDTPLVRVAWAAVESLGWIPATTASSTDANLPIALGIPAITINGGGRSSGAHGTEEVYEELPDSYKGPQLALLIVTALTGIAR